MPVTTPDEIRAFVLEQLAEPLADAGVDPATIDDDYDLVGSGLIDSFGLLELLTAVEARFGLAVDFEALDPDELTTLGPLSRFVAAQS